MGQILPFSDINAHEVINLFAYSGALPVTKGTVVTIVSGVQLTDNAMMLGDVGNHYNNAVSQRWGTRAQVTSCATGQAPVGLLLYGVAEVDENGNRLIFNPRKADEMEVVLSGQAVPILTRGLVLYSGCDGAPTAGATAYVSGGGLTTTNVNSAGYAVGTFLGPKDANGFVLLKVEL